MKFSLYVLAGVFGCIYAAPTISSGESAAVIIKFKTNERPQPVGDFLQQFNERSSRFSGESENEIKHDYDPRVFNGVAGKFSPEFLAAMKLEYDVDYVEEDGIMTAWGEQANPPSWGLTRVSQRKLDLSQSFKYADQAGAGIDVYIIDTGIDPTHPDFGGRAKMVKSIAQESNPNDMNGHGTHVAGTIGSATFGIAKKANLLGVKVLNGQGSGTYSDVIAGIQFVAQQAKPGKTVANMSLGGGKSQAVNDAIDAAVKAGVVMIVAAGNSSTDACTFSPAGAPLAFAVGSTDRTDAMSSFSNRGSCVKLFAPGRDITSTWIGGNGATRTISGTSMASPHVAGVAALYMSQKSYATVDAVYTLLKSSATSGVVTGLDAKSPNLMVFTGGNAREVVQEPVAASA